MCLFIPAVAATAGTPRMSAMLSLTSLVRGSGGRLEFTGHGFLVISTVMEAQPGGRRVTVKSHLPKTEILRICSFGRHSSPELEALSRGALTPTPRSERSAALVSTAQFRLRITCIPRGTGPRSRASRAGSRGPSCRRCEGRTGRASRCRGRSERAPRAA